MKKVLMLLLGSFALLPFSLSIAQGLPAQPYDIGSPILTDLWVDPINGSDGNSGSSASDALQTLTSAWDMIPLAQELTTGYHIHLLAGTFAPAAAPNYWESRYGTFAAPILIEAEPNTVILPNANIFDTRYLYFVGVTFQAVGGDPFHCERCDHLLLRGVTVIGDTPDSYNVQETVKINQSQYIYIEDSDISGAWGNPVDFVAVEYGHILGNRIHSGGDWCLYLKGGSAYFRVEGNEFYDCGTGGFTAGQGTGFEFMVSPWLQYEAYDIKFVNNIVHDTDGAGAGVNGGYNILIAYNTFYRVGARSHGLEVVFGLRGCDGNTDQCTAYLSQGGWGTNVIGDEEPIPNRNVFIYNNVLYNPSGYSSQWEHFAIYAPRSPSDGSNIPNPAVTDDNLQIRGNLIWNGGGDPNFPLMDESNAGCQNATCNPDQLRANNAINTLEPQLADPEKGDFRVLNAPPPLPIPDFTWDLADAPQGELSNLVLLRQ